MNWEVIRLKWNAIVGHAREEWRELTDEEYDYTEINKNQLIDKLIWKYGVRKQVAESRVDSFLKTHKHA
jgi:uncharacterized protein YjbJ (UPF0337 family)